MNEKERTRTSKFLSLVLRHEPQAAGLTLDQNGWVDVETLLDGCRRHGVNIDREALDEIVATSDKKRFAYSEDTKRIRANQGHSVEVSLGYAASNPPHQLFHGTASRFVAAIRAGGLQRMARHHVHLSPTAETARAVGQRHGQPVILSVRSAEMASQGHQFFQSENGVWLTDHVPVKFITFPEESLGTGKKSTRAGLAKETVKICEAGNYLSANGANVSVGEAIRSAKAGTQLHSLEDCASSPVAGGLGAAKLTVTSESTIAALQRLDAEPGGHLACLNFASAKNPGGGFLGGAEAQEESLARSSALYPCLLAAPGYYERNRGCRTTLYLDLAIWSPMVPFIRDDSGALLDSPVLASVITAPAPNAGAVANNEPERLVEVEPVLRRRAEFVLRVAVLHGVRRLVLGAWGCGVFRNDPKMVARAFRDLLRGSGPYAGAFDEVVFAIYDRSAGQSVLAAFTAELA